MNDMSARTTKAGRSYDLVEPQPRQGLVLTAVAFLIWAASMVLYPTPENPTAATNLGVGIALTGLFIGPALVLTGVRVAVGVRSRGWDLQPVWLGRPVVAGMLVLSFGAAATDAPRPVLAVAAAAMLIMLLGIIGAATQIRSLETQLATTAMIEQRARVAADVHDIVSHTLSVTMLHLSAARMALPEHPDDALESILDAERSGRRSMTDMRASLEILRTGGDPTRERTLDAADLPALIDGVRATGIDVTVTGDPTDDLPATVSTTLYRIVQEGLTNAMKHGTPPITISFGQTADGITVDITNPLDNGPEHRRGGESGTASARSRVEAIGGTFSSSPDPNGRTWRLSASIPTETQPNRSTNVPHNDTGAAS